MISGFLKHISEIANIKIATLVQDHRCIDGLLDCILSAGGLVASYQCQKVVLVRQDACERRLVLKTVLFQGQWWPLTCFRIEVQMSVNDLMLLTTVTRKQRTLVLLMGVQFIMDLESGLSG